MEHKIAEVIKDNDTFAITAHLGPEADAIGAQLGMKLILDSYGKTTYAVLNDFVPNNLKFLPAADSIIPSAQAVCVRTSASPSWMLLRR